MTRTFATVLSIERSDTHDKVGLVLGRFKTEESNMLTNDFKVGDCISDGNMVGWVYKWHGRLAYTYTSKCTERGMRWLDELPGDNWYRLAPEEVILTEKDRVTNWLGEKPQPVFVEADGELHRGWITCEPMLRWHNKYGISFVSQTGTSVEAIYRDPRPMPRIAAEIVPAKEKTLEEKVAEMIHDWALSDASLQTTKIAAEIVAMVKGGA